MESRLELRSNVKAYVLSIISGQTFFLLLENNFEGGYYVSLALGKDFCLTSCVLSEGRNDVYFILCLGLAQYLALFMKKLFLFVLFEWFGKGRWSQSQPFWVLPLSQSHLWFFSPGMLCLPVWIFQGLSQAFPPPGALHRLGQVGPSLFPLSEHL